MIYQTDIHALMTAIIYATGDKETTIAGAALQAEAIRLCVTKPDAGKSVRKATQLLVAYTPLPQHPEGGTHVHGTL